MDSENIKNNKKMITIKFIQSINFHGKGESYVRSVFLGG